MDKLEVNYYRPDVDKEKTLDNLRNIRDYASYMIRMYDADEVSKEDIYKMANQLWRMPRLAYILEKQVPMNADSNEN